MPSQNRSNLNPLWLLRVFPATAVVLLATAMLSRNANLHSFCVGAALGLLIGFCVFSFSVESLTLKNKPQPSDVSAYPLS